MEKKNYVVKRAFIHNGQPVPAGDGVLLSPKQARYLKPSGFVELAEHQPEPAPAEAAAPPAAEEDRGKVRRKKRDESEEGA